jgi:hypothetical protein
MAQALGKNYLADAARANFMKRAIVAFHRRQAKGGIFCLKRIMGNFPVDRYIDA